MWRMKRLVLLLISAAYIAVVFPGLASAQEKCSAADFGGVVDQTAQALRDLNINGSKRFRAKLDAARDRHGLSEEEIQLRAAAVQDERIDDFNKEIDTLVSRMDLLSQTPNDKIDCAKLEELKRIRDQLLTAMGQKSGYMLARIDVELAKPAAPPATATPPNRGAKGNLAVQAPPPVERTAPANDNRPQPEVQAAITPPTAAPTKLALNPELPEKRPAGLPDDPVRTARIDPAGVNDGAPPPVDRGTADQQAPDSDASQQDPAFRTETTVRTDGLPPADRAYARAPDEQPLAPPTRLAPPPDGALPPPDGEGNLTLPPDGYQQLPPPVDESGDSYSIDEIREAGRGIFGTITAEFAGAINYAFQQFGQPNAYIVGGEGGGAILAGLRYGSGTLHRKGTPSSEIFWQGPSLGYDLGAEGSRAIFLVYNLDDPTNIYGRFTGIGGSAYVAGGIGLNILGKGGMVMVPIRSGIGLRLGANVAYLKFTERQTWNPF